MGVLNKSKEYQISLKFMVYVSGGSIFKLNKEKDYLKFQIQNLLEF